MRKILLGGLLVLAALAAGCGDDDDAARPLPDGYPFAGTPDQLVDNFVLAQEETDLAEYTACLHPDFRFLLRPETVTEFSLPVGWFSYAQEVAIAEAMFSGEPASATVGAITKIAFAAFSPVADDWTDISGTTDFDLEAMFDVVLGFSQTTPDGDKEIVVRGRVTVQVAGEEVEVGGETRTRYRLGSIEDETGGVKGVEEIPWGSVKAQYLPEIVID